MKVLLSLVAALIGGAAVAVAFVATGAVNTDDSGTTETIVRQSPIAKGPQPARNSSGLTAGQMELAFVSATTTRDFPLPRS